MKNQPAVRSNFAAICCSRAAAEQRTALASGPIPAWWAFRRRWPRGQWLTVGYGVVITAATAAAIMAATGVPWRLRWVPWRLRAGAAVTAGGRLWLAAAAITGGWGWEDWGSASTSQRCRCTTRRSGGMGSPIYYARRRLLSVRRQGSSNTSPWHRRRNSRVKTAHRQPVGTDLIAYPKNGQSTSSQSEGQIRMPPLGGH